MKSVSRLMITSALLFGAAVRPAHAAASAPASDSSVVADTLRASGAPSAQQLEFLRRDIGGHSVHVWVGGERFATGHVRLGSAGVEFEREPGEVDPVVRGGEGDVGARVAISAAPASPLGLPPARAAWERVDRIDASRSSAMMGFGVGALVSVVGVASIQSSHLDPMDVIFYLLTVPATLVATTAIGAFVPHWKCLWQRPAVSPK